jgi:hypothetical protein
VRLSLTSKYVDTEAEEATVLEAVALQQVRIEQTKRTSCVL